MDKYIDLHAHTNYSDGELSPDELIKLAINNNISTLAITDHDTIDGLKNITYRSKNINVINGIELSAKVDVGTMHILGYDIDTQNKDLNNKLVELKDNSVNSVLSVIEQIKKDYNIFFTYQELKELINANHNLGRPDIARLLIKKGYVGIGDTFNVFISNKAYYVTGLVAEDKGHFIALCDKYLVKGTR